VTVGSPVAHKGKRQEVLVTPMREMGPPSRGSDRVIAVAERHTDPVGSSCLLRGEAAGGGGRGLVGGGQLGAAPVELVR
jgi:hypothetical protein